VSEALAEDVLAVGAGALGVTLEPPQVQQLMTLLDELLRWNLNVNLTSIDDPARALTHHLLDSLSANDELQGRRIADVGTGGGFPGLPLAVVNPQRQFTLIDAVAKKLRFVDHAVKVLGLANVTTRHARVERMQGEAPFDTVISRAFAPLPRLLEWMQPLCDEHTRVVAMKGRWPPVPGTDDAGPLPPGWQLEAARRVEVPGVSTERHLLRLTRAPALPRLA
jgi:16S rRNA (guanine527-N7)-methyltransferase